MRGAQGDGVGSMMDMACSRGGWWCRRGIGQCFPASTCATNGERRDRHPSSNRFSNARAERARRLRPAPANAPSGLVNLAHLPPKNLGEVEGGRGIRAVLRTFWRPRSAPLSRPLPHNCVGERRIRSRFGRLARVSRGAARRRSRPHAIGRCPRRATGPLPRRAFLLVPPNGRRPLPQLWTSGEGWGITSSSGRRPASPSSGCPAPPRRTAPRPSSAPRCAKSIRCVTRVRPPRSSNVTVTWNAPGSSSTSSPCRNTRRSGCTTSW